MLTLAEYNVKFQLWCTLIVKPYHSLKQTQIMLGNIGSFVRSKFIQSELSSEHSFFSWFETSHYPLLSFLCDRALIVISLFSGVGGFLLALLDNRKLWGGGQKVQADNENLASYFWLIAWAWRQRSLVYYTLRLHIVCMENTYNLNKRNGFVNSARFVQCWFISSIIM